MGAKKQEGEVRFVSQEELQAGVKLRAGHPVRLVIGGGAFPSSGGSPPGPAQTPDREPVAQEQIEIQLLTSSGAPAPGLEFALIFPDGSKQTGKTGRNGVIKFENLTQKGNCQLILPDFEKAPAHAS